MSIRTAALLGSCALISASCSSAPTSASAPVAQKTAYDVAIEDGHAYSIVVSRVGSMIDSLNSAERGAITAQHIEFTLEQSREDYLLASGPLVRPRAQSSLRSIAFLEDTMPGHAHDRMLDDPAVAAGALDIEAFRFICRDNLHAMPAMERSVTGDSGEFRPRPFVIVQAPTSDDFDGAIERLGDSVLFSGDCLGGSFEGHSICVLDCLTVDEAREMMKNSGPIRDGFVYHPWVSSVALTGMK